MTTRGIALPLTDAQRVTRALYLAGKVPLATLDSYVRRDAAELARMAYEFTNPEVHDAHVVMCPTLYYLLTEHNGGQDPCAPDPGERWSKPDSSFVNRTVDCSGGNAWMDGVDRLQKLRMATAVGYAGAFNTNSKIIDATRPMGPGSQPRCYEDVGRPYPGVGIVCKSGSPGHAVGHEGRVVGYRGANWDPKNRAHWALIDVVDCAARDGRSNMMTTGAGWFGTGALFLRCVMQP